MIKLSERLKKVADMVSFGGGAVDIGTDHAYIPIYLARKRAKDRLVASDIRKGPLTIAETNIKKYGLEGQIHTCLSDGLTKVEVCKGDSIIIAGMGGLLIRDILYRGVEKARIAKEMILQPQSEYSELRRFLSSSGFSINDEEALVEEGKFYFVIRACALDQGGYELSEAELEFGPVLLEKRHPVLKEYLIKCLKVEKGILDRLSKEKSGENVLLRIQQVVKRIAFIEKTLGEYYEMQ